MELKKGRTYFMITYADRDFTMPGIDPMVYVGKNAFVRCLENDRDTYQFQDIVSFMRFGYAMNMGAEKIDECHIEAFDEYSLGETLSLSKVLPKSCNGRFQSLTNLVTRC